MKIKEELIAKEKELLLPKTRHSTIRLKALISKDFIEIGSSGRKFGRKEVLKELPRERNFRAEISDIEFRMINEGVAQLIYIAKIDHENNEQFSYSRRNSIWKIESDTWKMVFHQGTKME